MPKREDIGLDTLPINMRLNAKQAPSTGLRPKPIVDGASDALLSLIIEMSGANARMTVRTLA